MAKIGQRRGARGFLTERRGTAAVEFAILSPLYLLLLMGMTAYGIYFGASHSVQQIAADAARVAISGLDEAERQTLARDFVARHARGYVFIEPEALSVEVADDPVDASQFVVAVAYDAGGLPIWGLFEGLAMPGKTIRRTSTIRVGGM